VSLRHPRASVENFYSPGFLTFRQYAHLNLLSRRRKGYGVAQQVEQHLPQKFAICLDPTMCRANFPTQRELFFLKIRLQNRAEFLKKDFAVYSVDMLLGWAGKC
jgi:hypothetical protein